jgi:single-stranded-DNA-specific exonuclease
MAKRADFNAIAGRFHIDPVLARIIRNRDLTEEEQIELYLNGTRNDFFDPHLLADAKAAVHILQQKIKEKQPIRVIGDYDIDGVNATYILVTSLRAAGAAVDYAIPDRMVHGYGLNQVLIDEAVKAGVDTIVTCDNGISAIPEIAYAKKMGLTVIVTDHHEVVYEETDGVRTYILPPADAVIDPKRTDCPYPNKSCCGAVVAWKVMQVLYEQMGLDMSKLDVLIENAGFATVGDVMDLIGENRVIVKEALKALNHTQNPGMRALINACGLSMGQIKAYHIGFVLGPCMNATGRLDTAGRAMELLLAQEQTVAEELAQSLVQLNEERKSMTLRGVEEAVMQIEQAPWKDDAVYVIYLPECHESLAGIIAGRIREKYNRPVFVLTKAAEGVKGSGRSIDAYSMYDEMCKVKHFFTKFGGHPLAAGLSMAEEDVDAFRQELNEKTTLTAADLVPKVTIDVPMPIDYISFELVGQIGILEPFGKGNAKPVFAEKSLKFIRARRIGKEGTMLKFTVCNDTGIRMEAICFLDADDVLETMCESNGKEEVEKLLSGRDCNVRQSVLYYPEINEYMGRKTLQIIITGIC